MIALHPRHHRLIHRLAAETGYSPAAILKAIVLGPCADSASCHLGAAPNPACPLDPDTGLKKCIVLCTLTNKPAGPTRTSHETEAGASGEKSPGQLAQ